VQTLASAKVADALNRYRAVEHGPPLRVFIQLNTSGEQTKGGIDITPSSSSPTTAEAGEGKYADEGESECAEERAEGQLAKLATHVIRSCPHLRLVGLMTIGKPDGGEEDFVALREVRDRLVRVWPDEGVWGVGAGEDTDLGLGQGEEEGEEMRARASGRRRLLLSMGMSHDFELALKAGADVVRVGTGIFGARPPK